MTGAPLDNSDAALSPFVEILRADWAELARSGESPLTEAEIEKIRGLGDF